MLLRSSWVTSATTSLTYFQPFFSYFFTILLSIDFVLYWYISSNLYPSLLFFHFPTTINLNVTLPLSLHLPFFFFFLLFWLFLSPSSYYKFHIPSQSIYIFLIQKKVTTHSLSLSHFFFMNFLIFCTFTLCWSNFVFFRTLLWVGKIWVCVCVFKLLFFFHCYIVYKNIMLSYSTTWIIWCDYNHILGFSHHLYSFIFLFSHLLEWAINFNFLYILLKFDSVSGSFISLLCLIWIRIVGALKV